MRKQVHNCQITCPQIFVFDFPSPLTFCVCLVAQSWPTLCDAMDCSLPASSVHGDLQARILEWVAMPSSRGSFQPRSPELQADSLPSEPPGKPKDTGVGSLALLQGVFLTQELNRGHLHCRQILHQLSNNGSPPLTLSACKFCINSCHPKIYSEVFSSMKGFSLYPN